VLHDVKGKVAISGYESPLMNALYGDWTRLEAPAKMAHSIKKTRTEVLWVNYDADQTMKVNSSQAALL